MYILSKYKDYYDYLMGIYGVDKKLILDRRNSESFLLPETGKIIFYIAGYVIECLVNNDTFYYGDALKPFIMDKFKTKKWWKGWKWLSSHKLRNYEKSYHIKFIGKYNIEEDWYYLEPEIDLEKINIKYNCPILIKTSYGISKYPKLATLKLPTFVPSEMIYEMLSGWLSQQITDKEKQTKDIPDSLKIESKGFDKKRSFRPKMK